MVRFNSTIFFTDSGVAFIFQANRNLLGAISFFFQIRGNLLRVVAFFFQDTESDPDLSLNNPVSLLLKAF